jgi:hypothetical protein
LVRVLDLLFWCPILVLALGILGFVGNSAAPLVGQLWVETAGVFFSHYFFISLVLWAVYCKQEV